MKRNAIIAALCLWSCLSQADLLDILGLRKASTNQASSAVATSLSQEQIIAGLREALAKGIKQSIDSLGRTNGFLTNLNVRIPVPQQLASAERTLRALKQDKLADEFVLTMNRAAEQAVPAASSVFVDALQQMTINDAKALLTGTDDAATQYFKRTTRTNLAERFLPIVKKATAENKVTSSYKSFLDKAAGTTTTNTFGGGKFGSILSKGETYLKNNAVDVDTYVTEKALDGLFLMIAEEEKKIRQNPTERTTELLQKVFGAVQR